MFVDQGLTAMGITIWLAILPGAEGKVQRPWYWWRSRCQGSTVTLNSIWY